MLEILTSALGALASRLVTALGGVGLSLIVGNTLGPDGLGVLMLGITILFGAATISRLGSDHLILRKGSIYIKENDQAGYHGLRRLVFFISTTLALLLTALGIAYNELIASALFDSSEAES